ncbi:hypothetical protein L7F22_057187 [Adiantum nelumboides]|nr:hypothetical protein [Adiantum nelumboides]
MPLQKANAAARPTTTIYALHLLMKCLFLLMTFSSFGTASAALYDAASLRGCPTASFTPNIVASKEEAELKVLVPNILSLRQIVNCSDPAHVRGFCIDVFEMALSMLTPSRTGSPNMSIHYTCFDFSSSPSASGPTYKDMVELVANGDFDVVVGDVTIGAERSSRVDFTQKYMESGVVILTNVAPDQLPTWFLFGWPFSLRMWSTIVGAFVLTGLLVCYLERNNHPEFTQGRITQRVSNVIWFTVEALVLLERESMKSGVARGLILAWLFFVVLLNASYTAGLSSFLTASNLSPTIPDLLSLKDSGQTIGYRRGSIVKDYLTLRFNIPEEKLVPIRMVPDVIGNLTGGVVAAVVDELPYTDIILSTLASSTCDFGIAGPQLTQEGFGFGFNKDRDLEKAFSIAIMNLTENGCLQDLQDKAGMSHTNKCSESIFPSNKVAWRSSISLFIPLSVSLSLCISVHYVKKYFWSKHDDSDEGLNVVEGVTVFIHPNITQRHQSGLIELQQYPFYTNRPT